MNILDNKACNLPLEIKKNILMYLDYKDIKWITDPCFWVKYWEKYNYEHPINNDCFTPNPEQQYTLSLIEQGKNIFINSPAGTGKSALIKNYWQQNFKKKVLGLTSTTGISALNIGGSTLHSFLGIGLGNEDVDQLYYKIIKNKEKRELWLKLDLLIIDEISMLHPNLFNKLEKIARMIRENKKKFGGIQLIVTGDLFQLPPVSQDSTLIINSYAFQKCIDITIEFRNIIRQNDPIFKNILNKIRIGVVDAQVKKILKQRFLKASNQQDIQIKPTKLFCTRKSVDHLNEKELNKLYCKGYLFREYIMEFVDQNCPISFDYIVKNFIKNSTTPLTLQICEQTQVMLTCNISTNLVNGSRGVITGFSPENYPIVKFINSETIVVKPIKFKLHCTLNCGKVKSVGYAIQIPLKIAYALTIHSCQGSTLDYASIDLTEIFEYGQAYTALSRVRTLDGLFLKKFNFNVIQAHPKALDFLNTYLS